MPKQNKKGRQKSECCSRYSGHAPDCPKVLQDREKEAELLRAFYSTYTGKKNER